MNNMMTSGKQLSQADVDALLSQSGLEGSYESEDSTEKSKRPEKKTVRSKQRSREEAQEISYRLYNKAFLEREEGVAVIWNAEGVVPMDPGQTIRIQGKDFITLGVLSERHLIIASR